MIFQITLNSGRFISCIFPSFSLQATTFVPNGSVPSHYNESDNNFNKINRSMDGSVHSTSHHSQQCIETLDSMGGGEAPACPPSPHSCHVPTGFNSDFTSDSQQESYSHAGCEPHKGIPAPGASRDVGVHCSCDSLASEGGGANSGKPKRRRKRASSRDSGVRDQATNTDLSSNGRHHSSLLLYSKCTAKACTATINMHIKTNC